MAWRDIREQICGLSGAWRVRSELREVMKLNHGRWPDLAQPLNRNKRGNNGSGVECVIG